MPKAINKKELCNYLQVQDAEERLMATLVKGSLKFISPSKINFSDDFFFFFGLNYKPNYEVMR